MMATRKHGSREQWEDDSMGIKAAEAHPRDITPISTPLAQREPAVVHPTPIQRIPRAPKDDPAITDAETYLLPKPPPNIVPIPEFTRNGKTSYLIDKVLHPHGGYVEHTAVLGADGGGIIWWQDTDWNHGGLSISMTFEQISTLYVAACAARKHGFKLSDLDGGKEGA